jgi:prepilin-type N-terminal cleavage/methylation domain-containing protein
MRLLKKRVRAFTLIEIMVVLAIMAALAGIVGTTAVGWYNNSKDKGAIANASILDLYKQKYLSEQGAVAQTAWVAAADDEARYSLIKGYLTSPPSLLGDGTGSGDYTPKGYLFTLNGLADPTTVTKLSSGAQIAPQVGDGTSYLISVSSSDSTRGMVLGGGTYRAGDTVTLNATPFSGFAFQRWKNGEDEVSTDASYSFTVEENRSLTAEFAVAAAGSYQLTVLRNNTLAGTVSPSSGPKGAGDAVTLTATPVAGWALSSWTGDIGSANPASSSITVTMDRDRVIQANFIRVTVSLTLIPSDATMGSVSGGGAMPAGTTAIITATAYPGFKFVRWLNGATQVSVTAQSSIVVSGNTALTAEFTAENIVGGEGPGGPYGDDSHSAQIYVDSHGLITSVTNVPIAGTIPTGVSAGTYGSSSSVGQFTVNEKGSLTGAANIPISIAESQVTGLVGKYLPLTGGNISGSLGVGTASSVARLQSSGAAQASQPTLGSPTGGALFLTNTDTKYGTLFGVASNGSSWIQSQRVDGGTASYPLLLQPSGGRVGIGTTDPEAPLHVRGNVLVDSYAAFISRYDYTDSWRGNLAWDHLQFGNNGPNVLIAGNTTAGGSFRFIVNNTNDLTGAYASSAANGILAMDISASGGVTAHNSLVVYGTTTTDTLVTGTLSATTLSGAAANNLIAYRRARIHTDDGTSMDQLDGSLETGFNYGTSSGVYGPYLTFGGLGVGQPGRYQAQLNLSYNGGGGIFKFRTRNDDSATWNSWYQVLTNANYGDYAIPKAQTTFGRVRTDTISRGSYGSISVSGSTNGYAGIDFGDADKTLMIGNGTNYTGVYKSNNTWLWAFDSTGMLVNGQVPWGSIYGRPSISGTWNYSGQSGQPVYLWGTNDGSNMYVWNPSNFTVKNVTNLSGTWSAINYFLANKGSSSYLGSQDSYGLEAYSNDGGAAAMSFHRGGYYAVNMGLDPDNVLRIGGWSAPSNRWQLDMSGNSTVAGNLSAAGGVLTLNGKQAINGADGYLRLNQAGQFSSGVYTPYAFRVDGGIVSGNAGAQGAGTIYATGNAWAASFTATSSRRFKEHIESLEPERLLSGALKLRPVEYDWKKGQGKGGHDIGFIAEEVNDIFPEVVGRDKDGVINGLDYDRLAVASIGAIHALKAQNDRLEVRLARLEQNSDVSGNQVRPLVIGLISWGLGLLAGMAFVFGWTRWDSRRSRGL